ncbi:flavin monoamine oxidase family protein [Paenibacillus sp. V4I5]|uniref:flavin monoamine oxidase family protein n=1 Tax=Paenibacillus sp. V4I5 TaxID=3042306 RepID=UPI0027931C10|nr:flavin monoamine oxidase family protein [Paenibacillus sp. V4I5]MDQ0915909.1 monoamine oxidase [Paenibacillus sp. V4I5]
MTANRHTDVIIVGAGLAGLSAALELRRNGKTVVVLEAQNRVGGRVFSEQRDGIIIDYGAQWISPYQTRVHALIKRYGLATTPTYRQGNTLFIMRGKRWTSRSDVPPLPVSSKLDLYRVRHKLDTMAERIDREEPWRSVLAERLDSQTMETWLAKTMFTSQGQSFCRLIAEEELSGTLTEVSMLDFMWELVSAGGVDRLFTGEEAWIVEGAHSLPDRIAAELGEAVRLQSPVQRIEWGVGGVSVHTGDGGCWKGDKVIVAIPPTFTIRIDYDPPLPFMRDQLCQKVGQGSASKFVVVYEYPFWRKNGMNGMAYSDSDLIRATMDSTMPGQSLGVLTALSSGREARNLGLMEEREREKEVLRCLANFFGDTAFRPLAYYEKDWSADRWARGGYGAHFGPGVLSQFGPSLTEPVGPIHWAGSETASEWRLYMEGALQSGERAAKEVLASTERQT